MNGHSSAFVEKESREGMVLVIGGINKEGRCGMLDRTPPPGYACKGDVVGIVECNPSTKFGAGNNRVPVSNNAHLCCIYVPQVGRIAEIVTVEDINDDRLPRGNCSQGVADGAAVFQSLQALWSVVGVSGHVDHQWLLSTAYRAREKTDKDDCDEVSHCES